MSDTPRTDAKMVEMITGDGPVKTRTNWVHHSVCRKLERELNAANERIRRLEVESESRWKLAQSAVESSAEMSSRIKRLEKAGDDIAAIIGPPGSALWADEDQVDAAWSNWNKAKEAKP